MPRVKNSVIEEIVEVDPVELVDYISIQKLAAKCEKSLSAVLAWYNDKRIIPDGYINDLKKERKANNAIFTPDNANSIIREVSKHGRPHIRHIKGSEEEESA